MKTIFTTIILFVGLNAQTGPGGVGNSTNNGLWLKADDIKLLDGQNISSWNDASGNNNNAFNNTVNQQPVYYNTSSLNNMPIIRLDGGNDQLIVNDADILDNSTGLNYFAVLRPNNLNNSTPRGILGKRIKFGVNNDYSYTWFFYTNNELYIDVETHNNRSSFGNFSNGQNYLLSFSFNGAEAQADRIKAFQGETLIHKTTENSYQISNGNADMVIGALNVDYGSYLGADLAEIIHYNFELNEAQKIIVNNYLSAKYNIPLVLNDVYLNDDNGDYDFEVAGIGRIDQNNLHQIAQGSGIVRVENARQLDDNEFFIWGHDNDSLKSGNIDTPPTTQSRLHRVWRVSQRDTLQNIINVGNVDISFDLTGLGSVTVQDLRLLIDLNNDGLFVDETPIAGAIDLGNNIYQFQNVSTLTDGMRFTLATINESQTPLPVELSLFEGICNENEINISWETLSEQNCHAFELDKSIDGLTWSTVNTQSCTQESNNLLSYNFIDNDLELNNYYRLRQVDLNGEETIYPSILVNCELSNTIIFPNPSNGTLHFNRGTSKKVYDLNGKLIGIISEEETEWNWPLNIANGMYLVYFFNANDQFISASKVNLLR